MKAITVDRVGEFYRVAKYTEMTNINQVRRRIYILNTFHRTKDIHFIETIRWEQILAKKIREIKSDNILN